MRNIRTPKAPEPIGPYSQAVSHGNTLYISGQIGIEPKLGTIVTGGVEAQAEQVMKNLEAILHHVGLTFENVLKCSIFLNDMADFSAVNAMYGKHFKEPFPARETVSVKGLPAGALVEISAIAGLD